MEQLKILEIINRWGYLNTYQISLLLNKEINAVDWLIRALIDKKLIRVDKLTRKNIYMLSSLGNRKLGKKSKSIRINYNELQHQDLLIKWLAQQFISNRKRTKSRKLSWKRISWLISSLWK
ncbi:hypothetical protein [Spiroplasma endosymbiont of Lariophagus distinguendus]|uniref:hypothetical protein n=1 Tax=Spiroplasma endosymbiont of Lariophagus distinguendus TaxID=2935082 RepID=UPI002079C9D3|nr:hypothetical protein [Spiroplasma endosymbiont of Lariophagus distinguendus]